jgi:hypothetical protein
MHVVARQGYGSLQVQIFGISFIELSRGRICNAPLAYWDTSIRKTEVIHVRGPWKTLDAVENVTIEQVDWFANRRLLGPTGNVPPAEFEREYRRLNQSLAMAALLKPADLRENRGGGAYDLTNRSSIPESRFRRSARSRDSLHGSIEPPRLRFADEANHSDGARGVARGLGGVWR